MNTESKNLDSVYINYTEAENQRLREALHWYANASYPDDGSGRAPDAFQVIAKNALGLPIAEMVKENIDKYTSPTNDEMFNEVRDALCKHHLTGAVAVFLADLAVRVKRLEDKTRSGN